MPPASHTYLRNTQLRARFSIQLAWPWLVCYLGSTEITFTDVHAGTYYPRVIKFRYLIGNVVHTGYATYGIQSHPDLLDAKGNSLLCMAANGCHRYLPEASSILYQAVKAGAAFDRIGLHFCTFNGSNHSDPPTRLGGGRQPSPPPGRERQGQQHRLLQAPRRLCRLRPIPQGVLHPRQVRRQMPQGAQGGPRLHCLLPPYKHGIFCRNGVGCLYQHGSAGAGPSSSISQVNTKCERPLYPPKYRYTYTRASAGTSASGPYALGGPFGAPEPPRKG
eukprot:scaffold17457_cov105-Isochrysis_galbana.AAC.2